MKYKESATVIEQKKIASEIYSLWIRTEQIAGEAKPGQFLSLYSREESRMLPRPVSICEIDREGGRIRMVYRVVGKGTEEFSRLTSGDRIEVLGPLGNGFPLDTGAKKAFLMGGGIGIPPMVQLARELNLEVQVIAGYRDEGRAVRERHALCGDGGWKRRNEGKCHGCRQGAWSDGGHHLCVRAKAHAARRQGLCRRKRDPLLALHGGADGVRNRRMSCLHMPVKRGGRTHPCTE